MPGINSPKIDSTNVLLSASIAAASAQLPADTTDHIYALGGALARSQNYAFSPKTSDTVKQHPEWNWLPGYKWNSLSKNPYTFIDRTWEALSGEVGPIVSVFALHYLSKRLGAHYQLLTADSGEAVADYVWRLGEAVGDYASSDSTSELLWRLFVSNVDVLNVSDQMDYASTSKTQRRVFWLFKRIAAYMPMLKNTVPEALCQHVLHATGFAGIAFDTPALNEHFALTFISSASADDPGRPQNAILDLDFVKNEMLFSSPEGRLEQALVELEKASTEYNITRIRFYPTVLGDQRKGGKLALFLRFYVNDQPSSLIRFPAEFGSGHDRTWWTEAVDRGILQGVYNSDQYTVVKWLNELANYKPHLVTPFSDRVLEQLPPIMKWVADMPPANDYGFKFGQQIHTAIEPDVISVDGGINLGLPNRPKQSTYHTAINTGDNGFLFIDDYFSQRVELPIMTMVTRSCYGDIKPDALVNLESHLPWRNYRGSNKMAMSILKNQAYSNLVSHLMKARSQELQAHREQVKKYAALPGAPSTAAIDMLSRFEEQLVGKGKDLQSAYEEQEGVVKANNKTAQRAYRRLKLNLSELDASLKQALQNEKTTKSELGKVKSAQLEGEKKVEEHFTSLPKQGQEKFEELKGLLVTLAESEEAGDGKTVNETKAEIKALTSKKELGLRNTQKILDEYDKRSKKVKTTQQSLETARETIKRHRLDISTKKADMIKLAKDNKEVAKLAEIEVLMRLSDAARYSEKPDSGVREDIEEAKKLGSILKLNSGDSLVDAVKEAFTTLYRSLPLPSLKSKETRPAKTKPVKGKKRTEAQEKQENPKLSAQKPTQVTIEDSVGHSETSSVNSRVSTDPVPQEPQKPLGRVQRTQDTSTPKGSSKTAVKSRDAQPVAPSDPQQEHQSSQRPSKTADQDRRTAEKGKAVKKPSFGKREGLRPRREPLPDVTDLDAVEPKASLHDAPVIAIPAAKVKREPQKESTEAKGVSKKQTGKEVIKKVVSKEKEPKNTSVQDREQPSPVSSSQVSRSSEDLSFSSEDPPPPPPAK